jgi:hypothetical protein
MTSYVIQRGGDVPAGDKIAVSLMVGPQVIELKTFVPKEEIIRLIKGPVEPGDDPDWHQFEGLNVNDQTVYIEIRRGGIGGFVIAPIVRMAVQPPGPGRVIQQ